MIQKEIYGWVLKPTEYIHYNTYQKKFETVKINLKEFPLLGNISPFQFLKGKDSTLWVGSKLGMAKYNHKDNQFKFYDSNKHSLIYAITKDKNNQIWAGRIYFRTFKI